MADAGAIYVIGDIHGQYKRLLKLLQDEGLVNHSHAWAAGAATLLFIGDFVDRGPDGIPVIDLVIQLQREAAEVGGRVVALLGNHEAMLLGAYRFGRRSTGLGSSFISKWLRNGGHRKDLASLTLQHLDWLSDLPAMTLIDDTLFVHADSPMYLKYGRTVEEVNTAFNKLLHRTSDALAWEEMLEDFARRGAFAGTNGQEFAQRFLKLYGAQRLVHGHTPIGLMLNSKPKTVTSPLIYAGGSCINVDGGLFLGGPGFVYKLPSA